MMVPQFDPLGGGANRPEIPLVAPDPWRSPRPTESASARRRKRRKKQRQPGAAAPRPAAPRAPKPPAQTPFNPFQPMYPTIEGMQQAAQRQAIDAVNYGMAGVDREFGTPGQIRSRVMQRGADIGELGAALNRLLMSNQQAAAQGAAATPGLAQGAYNQATQGSNAMLASLGAAPTAAQGLGVVGQMGGDVAAALQGGVQAAAQRTNLDQQANLRGLDELLRERAAAAFEVQSQRPTLENEFFNQIADRSFQQATAGDNSLLAWESLGLDKTQAQQDYMLGQAKLRQDAANDAANLDLKRDSLNSLNAYRQQQITNAKQRIDLDRRKWQQQVAQGKITAEAAKTKERGAMLREGQKLIRDLRAQMSETPGAAGGEQPTGQSNFTVTVSYMEPNPKNPPGSNIYPPTPKTTTTTVQAASWAEAQQKLQQTYGHYGPDVRFSNMGEEPITRDVPGSAGGKQRAWTDDQIQGELYNLYRSYGLSAAEAGRLARQALGRGSQPARSPGRTTGRRGVA